MKERRIDAGSEKPTVEELEEKLFTSRMRKEQSWRIKQENSLTNVTNSMERSETRAQKSSSFARNGTR